MPKLYIMRHGQAQNDAPSDIKRRLTHAGQNHIKHYAQQLRANKITFDWLIHSNAERARETARIASTVLGISAQHQFEDARIYNAELGNLVAVLNDIDEQLDCVLLVGHNPGLEALVLALSRQSVGLSTGSVAVVQAESWSDILNSHGRLISPW